MLNEQQIEEMNARFDAAFAEAGTDFEKLDGIIQNYINKDNEIDYRREHCNGLLNVYSLNYIRYSEKEDSLAKDSKKILIRNIKALLKVDDSSYWKSILAFLQKEYDKCLALIDDNIIEFFRENNGKLDEGGFSFDYLLPFKNAFPGFWKHFADLLVKDRCEDGLIEFVDQLERYYATDDKYEQADIMLSYISMYPNTICAKEILARDYMDMRRWKDAVALLEMVENKNVVFINETTFFDMAFCYGKIKKLKGEEEYYRKALDANPGTWNANNNLGYCLYKQKRFDEALNLFKICLSNNESLPYAANNYVSTLISLGKYKDANDFVQSRKFKVSKNIVDKLKKYENKNVKIDPVQIIETETDETEAISSERKKGIKEEKKYQFTSERILEDELTLRIESGREVFGKNLKIYEHKGDYYGRQYPFPFGRLDLLCEDENENLYIIELKKDSGYDDAYKQTADYIDWFQANKAKPGKKVYGIICLNTPTPAIIKKVKEDDRMQLFEYMISYTEIK